MDSLLCIKSEVTMVVPHECIAAKEAVACAVDGALNA